MSLFVSERFNRVVLRGLHRREQAEHDADEHRKAERDEHGRNAERHRDLRHRRDDRGQADADEYAEHAAQQRQHHSLRQKLHQDLAAARAERLFQTDLARALRDGDEHNVHHADAAHEQGDRGDGNEHDVCRRSQLLQICRLRQQILALVVQGAAVVGLQPERIVDKVRGAARSRSAGRCCRRSSVRAYR